MRTAPTIEARPSRRELPSWLLKTLAIAIPVLALLGFLLGRAGGEEQRAGRGSSVVAGPLTLSLTDDWRLLERVDPIAGLVLADSLAFALDDEDRPTELHRASRATPRARSSSRRHCSPSSTRCRAPRPSGSETCRRSATSACGTASSTRELTLYVVPTSRGAATIACVTLPVAPEDDAGASGASRCEDVATTLTLRGAQPRSLGPDERYGAAVDTVVAQLVRARAPARIALDEAETSVGQQRQARRLAAVYRTARSSLVRVQPGLIEAPVHRALVAALDSAVGAYGALSRAARDGDAAAFELAKANVRGAEDSFRRALGALGKIGYRIG